MIKTGLLFETQKANGFEETKGADSVHVCGVFGRLEGDRNVGLGAEIVDLIRLNLANDAGQV